jgi:sterol desaturase/sphingolipid hydroxylase (fatty acid hydroxylase superfamily)
LHLRAAEVIDGPVQELFILVGASFAFAPILLVILGWMYRSPRFASYRISNSAGMQVNMANRIKMSMITGTLTLSIILGTLYFGFNYLFVEGPIAWWRIILEAVSVVVVYDFIYYFAHRAMHHPKLLKHVHGVHHRARNPSVTESFYQHPAELVIGLTLLFTAVFIVNTIASVHVYSFGFLFFWYSTSNIIVHSGMDSRTKLLYPIDWLTRKHHAHHLGDPMKNFSTMTPLPDLVFGTKA